MSLYLDGFPTVSNLFDRCLKISKWVSLIYGLGAFQTHALVLGPGVSESICESFKSGLFVSYISIIFLDTIPIVSQSQIFWGSTVLCLIWNKNPSHLRKKNCAFEIPSECGYLLPFYRGEY